MPRIYYNKEELSGKSIKTSIINLETFQYIKDNTNEVTIKIPNNIWRIFSNRFSRFNYFEISRDDIEYKCSEGDFYLPDALIFYDIEDANFPSEFYFIARIKDELELRKCVAGEGILWFQIPNLHTEVTDKSIISKIEKTLEQVKKLVATTYNISIENERKRKKDEALLQKEKNKPHITQEEKAAYQQIAEICSTDKKMKWEFNLFLEELKSYDKYESLDSVVNYLNNNDICLIMHLDWKAGVEDLEWCLQLVLKQNYNQSFLEIVMLSSKSSSSQDDTFPKFDKKLRDNGFQMSFIDTESDEYVFVVHYADNKSQIKDAINNIGFQYYEAGNM